MKDTLPTTPKEIATYLEGYNRWRRGADDIEQPIPYELGVVLDRCVELLKDAHLTNASESIPGKS